MSLVASNEALGDYLASGIYSGMREQQRSREEALAAVLSSAIKKQYPVTDGDPGYQHRLTGVVLELKKKECNSRVVLYVGAPGGEAVTFECSRKTIDACKLGDGRGYNKRNDDEIALTLSPVLGRACTVPLKGVYKLAVLDERDPDGAVVVAQGSYTLDHLKCGGNYHHVRLRLQSESIARECLARSLPLHEVHLSVKHCKSGVLKVNNVELVQYLKPSPLMLLDKRTCVPHGPRLTAIPAAHVPHAFECEEERRACEPVNVPQGIAGAIELLLKNRLGSSGAHTFRFVAHVGSKQLCAVGSGDHHYAFSSCSEPFVSAAVIDYVQRRAPKTWRTFDLKDPEVLVYFLKESGALNVLDGLKCMYGSHCHELPSISDLLNHTAGLPQHFHLGEGDELIKRMEAASSLGRDAGESAAEVERFVGEMLARRCVPLYAPGTKHHHSHLGYFLLRYVFADWSQEAHCSTIDRFLNDIGMPSAGLAHHHHASARLAPACPTSSLGCVIDDSCESKNYAMSCGLVARVDEVALALSERNPWRQSPQKHRHAFLSHTLKPRVAICRELGIYSGYGWDHVGVPVEGYSKHGLRVVLKVGHSRGHHTTVIAMVPALGLSFALGTNADISCFADEEKSTGKFVLQLLQEITKHLTAIENCSMKAAAIFNVGCNAALAVAPQITCALPAYTRYCAGKSTLPENDVYVCALQGKKLYSLLDMRHAIATAQQAAIACEAVSVVAPAELTLERKGDLVLLRERTSHGDSIVHQLTYDPGAYRSSEHAKRAFASMNKGGALDTRGSGVYRLVDPHDGLLTEHVHICNDHVQLRGRLYVLPETYERIRVVVAPTVVDKLANQQLSLSTDQEDFSYANVLQSGSDIQGSVAALPQQQLPIGPRVGAGFGWRGGRGWGGFGLGLGLGTAFGAAYGYGYPYYAYGYPYYYRPAPVIAPAPGVVYV